MKKSKAFSLNEVDWKSIGMGALKVMIGALLTYITQLVSGYDFGVYTPMVMWTLTTGTNIAWKYIDGPKK